MWQLWQVQVTPPSPWLGKFPTFSGNHIREYRGLVVWRIIRCFGFHDLEKNLLASEVVRSPLAWFARCVFSIGFQFPLTGRMKQPTINAASQFSSPNTKNWNTKYGGYHWLRILNPSVTGRMKQPTINTASRLFTLSSTIHKYQILKLLGINYWKSKRIKIKSSHLAETRIWQIPVFGLSPS